jgi:hypothetical protein
MWSRAGLVLEKSQLSLLISETFVTCAGNFNHKRIPTHSVARTALNRCQRGEKHFSGWSKMKTEGLVLNPVLLHCSSVGVLFNPLNRSFCRV